MATSSDDIVEFLAQVPLFAVLSREELADPAEACREREVPAKSVLFFQNDPAHSLYIVRSGSIGVLLAHDDGQELILGEMRKGDYFGELGLITGRPRSTSAIALKKSDLVIMPGKHFLKLLDGHQDMTRELLETTCNRLYQSTAREAALAFLDAPARLARALLLLDQQYQEPGYITISQEALARRTGLTRQTVAKILGRWRRAGWLLTGRGRIVLLDLKALAEAERQHIG